MASHTVKINHETFGLILNESFVNASQFKMFLKMIQSSLEMKTDLSFFNGTDFLVHVPYKQLVNSVITTNVDVYSLAEHLINKSKIEAPELK